MSARPGSASTPPPAPCRGRSPPWAPSPTTRHSGWSGRGGRPRSAPDGMLAHLRDTYPIETAWAPAWAGDELRRARAGAWEARLAAIRATAEATTAARHGRREEA